MSLSSSTNINDFIDTHVVSCPNICSFKDNDIENIKKHFPPSTIFRAFDPKIRPDAKSETWIGFPEFPFKYLKLSFPFPPLIEEFFRTTQLSYGQAMPMLWRVLSVIDDLVKRKIDFNLADLKLCYTLQSFGPGYFVLKAKTKENRLFKDVTHNDVPWKGRFFFVLRKSLPQGSFLPPCWISKGRNNIYFYVKYSVICIY